jgi:hypothetical protein
MNSTQVAVFAASIGTIIIIAVLATAFPVKTPDVTSQAANLAALTLRYRRWDAAFGTCYFITCLLCTALIWTLFVAWSRWHSSLLVDADVKLTTGPAYYFIPAFFWSLLVGIAPVNWVGIRVLKTRYQEYEIYRSLKANSSVSRFNRFANFGYALACSTALFLGLNWYVLVRQDGLIVHRVFAVTEDRYNYAEVRSIRTAPALIAPNGHTVYRREFVATFSDGRKLSTNSLLMKLPEARKRTLMALISARSHIPVQEISVFQRGEL